jgi:hypothetical protein
MRTGMHIHYHGAEGVTGSRKAVDESPNDCTEIEREYTLYLNSVSANRNDVWRS